MNWSTKLTIVDDRVSEQFPLELNSQNGYTFLLYLVVCLEVIYLFVESVYPELLTDEHNCVKLVLESRLISRHSLYQALANSLANQLQLLDCLSLCWL